MDYINQCYLIQLEKLYTFINIIKWEVNLPTVFHEQFEGLVSPILYCMGTLMGNINITLENLFW